MAVEIVPGVTAGPEVAFGKPVIAGTRIPAALVLGQVAEGLDLADVCAEYDLTPEQVRAAMRYGAWLAEREAVRARSWSEWDDKEIARELDPWPYGPPR